MDDEGAMYVLHSGGIRGGRKGIGKSLFITNYKYGLIKLDNGLEYVQIGKLGDSTLPNNTANFVKEIDRIKKLIQGASSSSKSASIIAEIDYAHPTKDLIKKALRDLGKTKATKKELLTKLKEIIEHNDQALIDDETAWKEILELSDEL